ncbi:CDP-diacylglycerol--serine O-phosphatidyltransferase [Intestinicryptomonas porci]|uniref:CDP-diacylglycerol--serine O-phosphatidyltransferase n=1 Tax=Intestinicryptomonas porci TaxID=2926320 RepID=A0ABU4WEJ9_9BACT|nr:CDP-diacylglycerol--serine O-phosphatidyltransferase [Opitutales bacterium CLA-KB-P66]
MTQEKPALWSNVHQASKIYILPNFFTAGNLFFGFLSIILCMRGRFDAQTESAIHTIANFFVKTDPKTNPSASYYVVAILAILLSVFCDALDGRVARASGKTSLFGKEFDSIADSIAFGVAPSLLTFLLTLNPMHEQFSERMQSFISPIGWFVAFIYLLCGCIRLARFNVITNPYIAGHEKYEKGDFSGLPVPAAAGAMSSIALTMLHLDLWNYTLWIVPVMLLISFLMISNIPYPSFKHINWNTSARIRSFVAIIACIFLIIYMGVYSFTIIFLLYILIPPMMYLPKLYSILSYLFGKKLKKTE